MRCTASVLSVIPSTKQRRNPLFTASISGRLHNLRLFILWRTISAHATFLLQASIFRELQANKHNEQIKPTLCRLTIEMTPQIFLNTMPEEKHASNSVGSVGNSVNFCSTSRRRWDSAELPVKFWEEYLELAPELAHFALRLFPCSW